MAHRDPSETIAGRSPPGAVGCLRHSGYKVLNHIDFRGINEVGSIERIENSPELAAARGIHGGSAHGSSQRPAGFRLFASLVRQSPRQVVIMVQKLIVLRLNALTARLHSQVRFLHPAQPIFHRDI